MDVSYDITLAPVPDDGYKLQSLILYGGNNNVKLKIFTSNYTFNLTSWPNYTRFYVIATFVSDGGGGTDPDPGDGGDYYYTCYDLENGEYVNGYDEFGINTSDETIYAPTVSGYTYTGYWTYDNTFLACINDGKEYEGDSCSNHTSRWNHVMFFYDKNTPLWKYSTGSYSLNTSINDSTSSYTRNVSHTSGTIRKLTFAPTEEGYLIVEPLTPKSYVICSGTSSSLNNFDEYASSAKTVSSNITTNTMLKWSVSPGNTYYFYTLWENATDYSGYIKTRFTFEPSTKTILFNSNGGTGSFSSITATPGSTITIPSSYVPSRTEANIEFAGWNTSQLTTIQNYNYTATYQAGSSLTVNNNMTLYAIWRYKKFQVVFADYNQIGTGYSVGIYNRTGNINITFPSPFPYTIKQPANLDSTKKPTSKQVGKRNKTINYRFTGWSHSSYANKPSYHSGSTINVGYSLSSSILTYYAVWQPYFFFEDANGDRLTESYNGPLNKYITSDQMKELRDNINQYVQTVNNFSTTEANKRISMTDYNLLKLATKTNTNRITAKDFYDLQAAYNKTNKDSLGPEIPN